MRILIDECLPRKFKTYLQSYKCETVPEAGFAGKKNGELLRLAERDGFDVFLTMDRGIEYEQNIASSKLGIVLLRARSNRLADLLPDVASIVRILPELKPGELVRVGIPGK